MLNLNTKKLSYMSAHVQNVLNSFVVFGTNCQLCGKSDLTNMELEHLETKAKDADAIYPCCGSHNRNKSNRDASKWFELKGLTSLYKELQNKVQQFNNVQQFERDNAYIAYMEEMVSVLTNSIDTLPDGIIRMMCSPIARDLLNGLTLDGVRVDRNQAIQHGLTKWFDCSNVIWE